MYRACIFDLDGTLADTLDSLTFSINETLARIGMPEITEEQCRQFVGNGARVLVEKALQAGGDDTLSRFSEAFRIYGDVFDKNCSYHVKAYQGIGSMLAAMKEKGLKLGVLSNKPDRQAVRVTEALFGRGIFDQIQGQRPDVPRKPDPSALFLMAEKFGAKPEEVLYIGDSEVDAAAGRAARMDTVLVSWGFRPRSILEEAVPDRIVDSAEEILEMITEAGK